MIHKDHVQVHQADCTVVTNLRIATANHDHQFSGSTSIGHSQPVGVSAQANQITLSGWSGEIRGEIAVKLSLAAVPLRTRLSFEIFGALPKSSK
ncbi:hypothetical protein ACFQHW_10665 [Lapidilactobacillus achengensis]|uniref:Uncharacterized protein n=1 Tax=Lapidilactobacillus achengensis TaxID=2486000 RepID=A0ABW1UPX3_9LACO|nr:hypothetical protein [Lapidilactobacillus achengensis]